MNWPVGLCQIVCGAKDWTESWYWLSLAVVEIPDIFYVAYFHSLWGYMPLDTSLCFRRTGI